MKKLLLSTVAGLAIAGSSFAANAAGNTATATADALATVVAPISVTQAQGNALDFATFTVDDAGSVVSDGTYTNATLVAGAASDATFDVSGGAGFTYDVTVPATITLIDADDVALTVEGGANGRTLDAAGDDTFAVEGTLTLDGTEVAGSYSTTFDATVTYQ